MGLILIGAIALYLYTRSNTAQAMALPPQIDPERIVRVQGHGGVQVPIKWRTLAAFQALQRAAAMAGFELRATSGFRTYAEQDELWQKALKKYGTAAKARKATSPPGNSQHELGRAIDVWLGFENDISNRAKIQATPAYKWLEKNINAYGFRFYDRNIEPWHIEYVD